MIRVAHYVSTSGLYGAERWVLGLLRHMRGIETCLVFTSDSDESLYRESQNMGLTARWLKVKGHYSLLDLIAKVRESLARDQIDILHTHGYKSDIIGYFAARKNSTKIVSTPHGWSKNEGLKVAFWEKLNRMMLSRFDKVLPLSRELLHSLSHVNPNKLQLIQNFVDLQDLPQPRAGDIQLVTYIGQLIERKRVQDLISALQFVPNRGIKLQIIGDGPSRKSLEELVSQLRLTDRVDFMGYRRDRLELLNRSQIVVLPSILEGIPRVLMEAMGMQKTVVGTDIMGIHDLVTNMKTGILVPTHSPEKIAEAIEFLVDHPAECAQFAANGHAHIKSEFSAEAGARAYEALYKEVMEEKAMEESPSTMSPAPTYRRRTAREAESVSRIR